MELTRRTLIGALAAGCAIPLGAARLTTSDPQWVRTLLLALHPGLTRYQTLGEFERRYRSFAAGWVARPTLEQRFLSLSRLLAHIRCGHSYVNPYNQSDALVERLTGGRRLLPFTFRWLPDGMVVSGDPHGVGLVPGTVIHAVDGVPARAILAALLPYARADGGNNAKRRANMEVRGQDEFEAFDLFHPLLFRVGPAIALDLTQPGGRRLTRQVATVTRADRLAKRPPEPPRDSARPLWSVERRGRTAILTMPGWALYNSKWDWRSWLDARFAEWVGDGTTGLVVDLRGNEGGLDCGDRIIAHLTTRPLAAPRQRRLVRFREVPAELRPLLDTWDPSFFTLGKDAVAGAGRLLELGDSNRGGWSAIDPVAPRFTGKVAVITEPMNSSATFGFAQRLKGSGLATLVGEETGGNRQGINGGAFFFARLPGSGLEFDIPLIWQTPDTPQPDEGILPDVPVPLMAADLANGRDTRLERAVALVS